jgi:inner membrane protein COX18
VSYHSSLALAPIASAAPPDVVDPAASASFFDPMVALLLTSPLPAGLTILLLTFTFRSAITLPATLWQRRRMQRTKEIIRPAMKALNDKLAGVVAKECRAKGMDYEAYKKELKSQASSLWRP